jgi:hypothetical protein
LTNNPPPAISSAIAALDGNGTRIVVIAGTNLAEDTQILFNGVAAPIRSFDRGTGSMTVIAPPGPPGETARVVALNRDGQSSLFVQQPSVYEFDNADTSGFVVWPTSLPAGSEAVLEILGSGGAFSSAYTSVAFGSSAIQVRRIFLSPVRIACWSTCRWLRMPPGGSTVSVNACARPACREASRLLPPHLGYPCCVAGDRCRNGTHRDRRVAPLRFM